MKLIKKSEVRRDLIEVRLATLAERAINKLLPGAIKERTPEFKGRTTFGRCYVQFDYLVAGVDFPTSPFKQDVVFGTELYQGVKPIRHLGERVYECTVDCVSEIQIGTIHRGDGNDSAP